MLQIGLAYRKLTAAHKQWTRRKSNLLPHLHRWRGSYLLGQRFENKGNILRMQTGRVWLVACCWIKLGSQLHQNEHLSFLWFVHMPTSLPLVPSFMAKVPWAENTFLSLRSETQLVYYEKFISYPCLKCVGMFLSHCCSLTSLTSLSYCFCEIIRNRKTPLWPPQFQPY